MPTAKEAGLSESNPLAGAESVSPPTSSTATNDAPPVLPVVVPVATTDHSQENIAPQTDVAATSVVSSNSSNGRSPRYTVSSSVEILSNSGARSGARETQKVESSLYTSSDSIYSTNNST